MSDQSNKEEPVKIPWKYIGWAISAGAILILVFLYGWQVKSISILGFELNPPATPALTIPTSTTVPSTGQQPAGLDTTTSATSTQPASVGNLLFSEDFEDGFADGFSFQSGNWKVVDDSKGNKVLEMTSTTCCANGLFGPSSMSDGIVEFRYKLINANYQAQHHVATFGFRLNITSGNFTSYSLIYEPDGSTLNFIYQENGGEWQPIERSSGGGSIQPQEDNWTTLRVEFQGENIKVFVNGNSFMSAQDSRDKAGALILGANGAVTVQFDDIKVWEYSK